ncbi:hypothetical protein FSY45_20530 [Comamonas sp. Z1]|jgi:hypothetical protein|uniref:Uncharacterized protein n=1 Tax=Comamonas thiooxydans TaxID=363952 RepID=A0A0E3BYV4_9BURK|nr:MULTISPECIES: hypothetical protein [Comamonas]KGH12720.1 hypothetical protein P608_10240 [Comamonas thiooxydans]KGH13802.1 hypothetical protein P607_24000 [Comamonas thiooxydans]TYK74222.1 hypothetical protein FSY45_20530 [Comamonas sp. Z1]UBQ44492.1 hypothetical protein LCH15_25835 [Comamonas thiooxydans]UUC96410.1 hypothetical protein NOX35_27460 [Comamonas sp. C11]
MAMIPSIHKPELGQMSFDFLDQTMTSQQYSYSEHGKSYLSLKTCNKNIESLISSLSLDFDICAPETGAYVQETSEHDEVDEENLDNTEKFVWSDDDIDKLRTAFFDENIRLLGDGRTSPETRQENYEWLMSDEIHPFSFLVLCREEMLSPDRIREGVQVVMRKLGYLN